MIEADLNFGPLERALKAVPEKLPRHLNRELARFGAEMLDEFATERLGVPDDRDPGDFLQRRPRQSKGLVNRSGQTARDLYSRANNATKLHDVELRMGFASERTARIARVHELGTVGKGGELPDITPKKGPFLAIPVRGLGAALSAKRARVVMVPKVAIPPRLGWRAHFRSKETQQSLGAALKRAGDGALSESARGSGGRG